MNSPPVAGLPAFVIVAENVFATLVIAEVGEMALALRSDNTTLTATEFEQLTPAELPPEVIVTAPLFVPVVEYVLDTDAPVPERLSVPLHEYVYEPVPPDADAIQVTISSVYTLVGDTAHDAVRGVLETVTYALPDTLGGGDVTWHEYKSVVIPHPGPIVFTLHVEGGEVHDLP